MRVTANFAETRQASSGRTALVPTMGALHAGHLSLIEAARAVADRVVVSLFVNPLQFNDSSDLARYPRDFDRDAGMCERAGVDVLFAPTVDEMYPTDPLVRVSVGPVGDHMEGQHRPGHFEGVATVVVKLLAGIQPAVAVFGRKDAQQVAVVRSVVTDLSFPVEIVGVSTVREPDGLAMSSRNVFLSAAARRSATGLSRGLMRAADLVDGGERSAATLAEAVRAEATEVALDYVLLADQERAQPLPVLDRAAFLAVAGVVGGVRLIDNVAFDGNDPFEADRGVMVSGSDR
jgi:pantoate--beta-alanine ligase